MPICSRFLPMLLLPLASLVSICGVAQETASPTRSTPSEIHLDVVVTPKSGSPVMSGLTQQDFIVVDNKASQPITSFQAVSGSQAPVEVVLLVDAVNTSFQTVSFVRTQVGQFLTANGGHLAHPTALAVLKDDGIQMQQSFTTDGNAINSVFDKYAIGLREIRRSQGVYGADERFDLSLKALRQLALTISSQPGRKIILWVSPGWPILSGPNIQLDAKQARQLFAVIVDVSTGLRRAGITLYAVDPLGTDEGLAQTNYYEQFVKGVAKPNNVNIGNLSLQVLAVQSGGLAISSTGVNEMLQKCLADTDAYYEISFRAAPAEKPDEYHHIELKVDKPGMVARTRQGYYAQP